MSAQSARCFHKFAHILREYNTGFVITILLVGIADPDSLQTGALVERIITEISIARKCDALQTGAFVKCQISNTYKAIRKVNLCQI